MSDINTFARLARRLRCVDDQRRCQRPFLKELGTKDLAEDIPVVAFSVGEEELAGLDTKPLVGHLAAWNYFMSVKSPVNDAWIKKWHAYTKNPKRTFNDPMEAHVIGIEMWVKAVEKAKSTETDKVAAAIIGIEVPNLTGGTAKMLPNHHLTKPVLIGEVRADVMTPYGNQAPCLRCMTDFLPASRHRRGWVTLNAATTTKDQSARTKL